MAGSTSKLKRIWRFCAHHVSKKNLRLAKEHFAVIQQSKEGPWKKWRLSEWDAFLSQEFRITTEVEAESLWEVRYCHPKLEWSERVRRNDSGHGDKTKANREEKGTRTDGRAEAWLNDWDDCIKECAIGYQLESIAQEKMDGRDQRILNNHKNHKFTVKTKIEWFGI